MEVLIAIFIGFIISVAITAICAIEIFKIFGRIDFDSLTVEQLESLRNPIVKYNTMLKYRKRYRRR